LTVIEETRELRRELAALAAEPEWDLLTRYDLLGNKSPQSLQQRALRCIRRLLAATGLFLPHVTKYPWLPTLKHTPAPAGARSLLIWALGVEGDDLRQACEGVIDRLAGRIDFIPVLVTDVADFAYFSRLGWLVEYLPALSGEGNSYRERKRRYLAWRYRDALIVPVSAGCLDQAKWDELLGLSVS
jgi:hypothetical protein